MRLRTWSPTHRRRCRPLRVHRQFWVCCLHRPRQCLRSRKVCQISRWHRPRCQPRPRFLRISPSLRCPRLRVRPHRRSCQGRGCPENERRFIIPRPERRRKRRRLQKWQQPQGPMARQESVPGWPGPGTSSYAIDVCILGPGAPAKSKNLRSLDRFQFPASPPGFHPRDPRRSSARTFKRRNTMRYKQMPAAPATL